MAGEEIHLASHVPELDLIVSGHSHTLLKEPVVVNEIPIVQAGSDGKYLGEMTLNIRSKKIKDFEYKFYSIDDQISSDSEIVGYIEEAKKHISRKFLAPHNLDFDTPILEVDSNATRSSFSLAIGQLVTSAIKNR